MNPAAYTIVDQMMGNEEITFDARTAARRLLAVSLIIAVPLGAAAFMDAHRAEQVETLSASLETVSAAQAMIQAAHAGGIANGLVIGGAYVPAELVERIEAIVETEVVSGARVLAAARLSGVEDALSGNWTAERLNEYVSRIETSDPDLRLIITEEADNLTRAGVDPDHAQTLMRAMTVRLMTGEADKAADLSRHAVSASEAERLAILDKAQNRIWFRLEETERIGGLDPLLTRDLVVSLIGRTISPAQDSGPASPG